MFIAHLPAGYLLSKCFESKSKTQKIPWKIFLTLGLIGSILPDLDLFYFYLIDARQHQHHSYWTHIPIYWICIYFFAAGIFILKKNKKMLFITTFIFIEIMLHIFLDTIAGGILWAYPKNTEYFSFFTVLPQYNWWVLNFILHWSFLLEIAILLLAFTIFKTSNNKITKDLKVLNSEA